MQKQIFIAWITIWLSLILASYFTMHTLQAQTTAGFADGSIANDQGTTQTADINGDGLADVIVGGWEPNAALPHPLLWYAAPNWTPTTIANIVLATDNFDAADIDGDGDMDVVIAQDYLPQNTNNIVWYENQGGGGSWTPHIIGGHSDPDEGYVKDIKVGDFNNDNRLDVAIRSHTRLSIFTQPTAGATADNWTQLQYLTIPIHEGMDIGDLDADGDIDIALNGYWVENGPWTQHTFDAKWYNQSGDWTSNNAKIEVVDVDKDGNNDILISHSERAGYPVSWYENTGSPTIWTEHVIAPIGEMDYVHTVQGKDFDGDGDVDILAGEMPKNGNGDVVIYYNTGDNVTFSRETIGTGGLYSGHATDMGADGDYDVIGSQNWDQSPIRLLENQLNLAATLPLTEWHYISVDGTPESGGNGPDNIAFGLTMTDVNADTYLDIAAGRWVYHNPGGDMTGTWSQYDLPDNADVRLSVNVDDDAFADLIAVNAPNLYWLEADASGTMWTSTVVGTIPANGYYPNSQGAALAQIVPGGKPEIILPGGANTNGSNVQIYYFQIPSTPQTGNWPRVQITDKATEEGLYAADIDADGDVDLASSYYNNAEGLNGNNVAWYQNPGDGSANWPIYRIGSTTEWADRIAIADLNGDNRPDIIVTEENNGTSANASTYWYEAPADPTQTNWIRRTIKTGYTTNSLSIGDFDADGDTDIVTGEHRGTKSLQIWANDGSGTFTAHEIDSGKENHLGALNTDMDNDGDLDLVSIAYDDFGQVHLWRNNAIGSTTTPSAPPTDGLVGHWGLDENSGTSANDGSGNHHHGALINSPAWAAGKVGAALSFDGSNYVQIPNHAQLQIVDDITIAAWVRKTALTIQGNSMGIVSKSNASSWDYDLFMSTNFLEKPAFYSQVFPGSSEILSDEPLTLNQWHHVAVTRDRGTGIGQIYVDGILTGRNFPAGTELNQPFPTSTNPLYIGHDQTGGFVGEIDEVYLYNRVLTSSEIQSFLGSDIVPTPTRQPTIQPTATPTSIGEPTSVPDASPTSPGTTTTPVTSTPTPVPQPGPILHWENDDLSGEDASSNSHDATLNNAPALITGKRDGALSFNGVNQYLSITNADLSTPFPAHSTSALNQFSFSAWVNPNQLDAGDYDPILAKQGNNQRGYVLTVDKGNLLFQLYKSNEANDKTEVRTNAAIPTNSWSHVAVTYQYRTDGTSQIRLYINGALEASSDAAVGPPQTNSEAFEVGRYYWSASYNRYFNGAIDDIRVYDVSLTNAEILGLFSGTPLTQTDMPAIHLPVILR